MVGKAGRYMSTASGPVAMTAPSTHVRRATPSPGFTPSSTFDAQHLLEGVHDLDEIGLVRHYLVDVLVGAGNLVQHALVLAAEDAFGLRFQILNGEALLRRVSAHASSGAV